MSLDSRDYSKEPPAMLDPLWVLLMRERLRNFQATGNLEWYAGKVEDWSPAKTQGPAADGTSNN